MGVDELPHRERRRFAAERLVEPCLRAEELLYGLRHAIHHQFAAVWPCAQSVSPDCFSQETQLKLMRPGQPVRIHVDAFDRYVTGTVDNLPGAAGTLFSLLPPENASGNFVKVIQRLPVRIRFNAGQDTLHVLRPGMSVEPTVKVR